MSNRIKASIIIPVLNEEKYIGICIDSLLKQTYPMEQMEWLIIDGGSKDNTVNVVNIYIKKYPDLIKVFDNKKRTQACAMNIGIQKAVGEFVIRLDAHAEYANNYIEECVRLLETGKYANVGGIATTKGRNRYGNIISCMLSSKFGVGNSSFRTEQKSAIVDTVPFGAFNKEYLKAIGGFDERLNRNEDNEINYRIKKNGGIIFLSDTINFTYYCRDSFRGIVNMAFQNGKWTVIASKMCPGSMRLRHFVPLVFVLSLLGGLIGALYTRIITWMLVIELLLYLLLDFYFSVKASKKREYILHLIYLFPSFHIAYGIGSLRGLLELPLIYRRETNG